MINHSAVKYVSTTEELKAEHDWSSHQLVLQPRKLEGDYDGLALTLTQIGLLTDCFQGITIGDPATTDANQSFEEVYEKARSFLTEQQDRAFRQILCDVDAIKDFHPQLDIELGETVHGSMGWHLDSGYEQGRFLCTYTTKSTEIRLDMLEASVGVGTFSRHTVINSQRAIPPLRHRRPSDTGASPQAPRLNLKTMRADPEYA